MRASAAVEIGLTMPSPIQIPAPVTIAWPNRPPKNR
jgi:hypothetical protein